MRCYSANVWETLIEALHVYWQVVKEKWPALLAVFVPLQLVMALYRLAVASSGVVKISNLRYENFVATVLGLTIGLLADAIAIDHAFFKCTGQRRPSGGGIAAAWGRMMATGWLRMIIEVAVAIVVVVISTVVISLGLAAPLVKLGGTAAVFGGIVTFIVLAPLIAVVVWIIVRWSFAVVLSAIHPIMGPSALGESWRFVRARVGRCILLVVVAWLVMTGISAIPSLLAQWYAIGEPLGMPVPAGTALTRTAAQFLAGLFISFGSLFVAVAMTTFWVRTLEPRDLPESLRRSGARLLIPVLFVLGVLTYAFAGYVGVKAARLAREESAQQRAAQRAEMLKAIEQLQEKPIEQDRGWSVVHALPDAYKVEHMRMENGELVVDSPFDLCIGSTECAKMLGSQLTSSRVDFTYSYGMNQNYYGFARLATPYFGFNKMSLTFLGEEKALYAINLFQEGSGLSLGDCRKTVRDIAADIEQRFGVKTGGTLMDSTDEAALKLGDDDNRWCSSEFIARETRMNNGRKIVRYRVRGMIVNKTKKLSIEFSIDEMDER